MNLVEIKDQEPMTTTLVIADGMKIKHNAMLQLVNKYDNILQEIKTFQFEIEKSGGRPTRFAWFNEEQTLFLVSLMKNSEVVVKFKARLAKDFMRMKRMLEQHRNIRLLGIERRKNLTDAIKDSGENERMHGHGYSTYTKITYKLLGIEYKKPGKGEPPFRDTLTATELKSVENIEDIVKGLINLGKQYEEIKGTLFPAFNLEYKPKKEKQN